METRNHESSSAIHDSKRQDITFGNGEFRSVHETTSRAADTRYKLDERVASVDDKEMLEDGHQSSLKKGGALERPVFPRDLKGGTEFPADSAMGKDEFETVIQPGRQYGLPYRCLWCDIVVCTVLGVHRNARLFFVHLEHSLRSPSKINGSGDEGNCNLGCK